MLLVTPSPAADTFNEDVHFACFTCMQSSICLTEMFYSRVILPVVGGFHYLMQSSNINVLAVHVWKGL